MKRVSIVSAELQHAAVEAQIGIRLRRVKIEVLPKGQTWTATFEEIKLGRAESLVAYHARIINVCSIGRGIRRRHWHSGI